MKVNLKSLSIFCLKQRFTSSARPSLSADNLQKQYSRAEDAYGSEGKPPTAPNHGGLCPANAIATPMARKVDLTLPPRTQNEFMDRHHLLSDAQGKWCKVNTPSLAKWSKTEEDIREFKGAPYPAKNTVEVAGKPRILTPPTTVAEYKTMVQRMTIDQLHWSL